MASEFLAVLERAAGEARSIADQMRVTADEIAGFTPSSRQRAQALRSYAQQIVALHDFLLAAYSNPDGPRGADQVLLTRRSVLKGAGAVLVAAVSGVSGACASQLMDGDTGLLSRLDALEETVDEAFAGDHEELDVVGDAATDFEYFNELNGIRRELARVHEEVADHTDEFGFGPIEASAMPILQALTITRSDAREHLEPRVQGDDALRDVVDAQLRQVEQMGEIFGGFD